MPRFYFDCFDGWEWVRDDVGLECPSLDRALAEAQDALPELARDMLPDGPALSIRVRIRDQKDVFVGEAALDISTSPRSPAAAASARLDGHRRY
jgi:uncharacterized protein DUF6894